MNNKAGKIKQSVGIIIQARMNSSRLPGKIMLDVAGEPVLKHIINRVKACTQPDAVIIATTDSQKDNVVADFAAKNNSKIFRGSESDVLSRYYFAAKENNIDVIVRITADCPFIDPAVVDKMILSYLDSDKVDYLSNTINRTFPRGLDVEIFSFKALEEAFRHADKDYQREHVTPYIYQHPEKFSLRNFEHNQDFSGYRLVLDTDEDYKVVKIIYESLYPVNKKFGLEEVVGYLKENSGILEINKHVEQKKLC